MVLDKSTHIIYNIGYNKDNVEDAIKRFQKKLSESFNIEKDFKEEQQHHYKGLISRYDTYNYAILVKNVTGNLTIKVNYERPLDENLAQEDIKNIETIIEQIF